MACLHVGVWRKKKRLQVNKRRRWLCLWSRFKIWQMGDRSLTKRLWLFTVNTPPGRVSHITGIPTQHDSMCVWCGFGTGQSSASQKKTLSTDTALCNRWFNVVKVQPRHAGDQSQNVSDVYSPGRVEQSKLKAGSRRWDPVLEYSSVSKGFWPWNKKR